MPKKKYEFAWQQLQLSRAAKSLPAHFPALRCCARPERPEDHTESNPGTDPSI
jgi:hypothetical protein